MTEQEINCAIELALGRIRKIVKEDGEEWFELLDASLDGVLCGGSYEWCLDELKARARNFYASLDACAEFEKALSGDEREAYANELFSVCPCDENHGPAGDDMEDVMIPSMFTLVTATAPQRCRAFLRVKGIWREQI